MTLRCTFALFCLGISSFLLNSMAYAQINASRIKADEYIVKMKVSDVSGQNSSQKLAANKAALSKGLRIMGALGKDIQIQKTFSGSGMIHLSSKAKDKIEFLKNHPDVEYVEPNFILSIDPIKVDAQGSAPTSADYYSQSYAQVQVDQAWDIAKPYNQGTNTVVAVIDTGLDLTHGVFADSHGVWENTAEKNGTPGVDDDGNGYVDDINGWNFVAHSAAMFDDADHGTHVAGIVLGVGQDIFSDPVREARLKIMPLKFLDRYGSGSTSDAISAIYYAVANGARVINNSWGGSSYSRALHEAYTYAYEHGVVIVSAAGNSGVNLDTAPMYPAALDTPSNITVIATNDGDGKASFSNYSTTLAHVAAPGVAITSTVPGTGCYAPGCYQMLSGTSMAAPFVAGLAGLILREAPQLSAYQVKGIVLGSVDVKSNLASRAQSSGRVNVYKAIQTAIASVGTATWSPSYSPSYKSDARSVASAEGPAAGGCGLVKMMVDGRDDGGGPSDGLTGGSLTLVFAMILLPMIAAVSMRSRKPTRRTVEAPGMTGMAPLYRRQFERFNVAKEIAIRIGDQVYKSASDTLSVGGLSFQGNLTVEKGQKIKVKIDSHNEEIDAEIVWCSQKQSYGVKFLTVTEALKQQVSIWTAGMTPA